MTESQKPKTNVRVLSIHQPWCWALAAAIKTIELRDWQNPYRGLVFFHTTKQDPEAVDFIYNHVEGRIKQAILGYGYLYAIRKYAGSAVDFAADEMYHLNKPWRDYWRRGLYGWKFRGAYLFKTPVPCRGFPKLWTPRPELLEKLKDQMKGQDACGIAD